MVTPEKVTVPFVKDATLSLAVFGRFPRSNFRGFRNSLGGKVVMSVELEFLFV
jgi:hypothetical protein